MPISGYQIESGHPPIGMGMSFVNLELVKGASVSCFNLQKFTALHRLIVNYVRWGRKLRLITIT